MWQFTLIFIAFALFVMYNAVLVLNSGVPKSLSESFYVYENHRKGLGYVFTVFLFVMVGLMLPAWLELSDMLNDNFTFLVFLSMTSFTFVATAPAFKINPMASVIHNIGAWIGAGCALLWCFIVCNHIWWISLIAALIPVFIYIFSCQDKKTIIYWLELIAFSVIFATIITASILLP